MAQIQYQQYINSDIMNTSYINTRVGECVRESLIHNKKYVMNPEENFERTTQLSKYVWKHIINYEGDDRDFEVPPEMHLKFGKTVQTTVLKHLMTKRSTIVSLLKASSIKMFKRGKMPTVVF